MDSEGGGGRKRGTKVGTAPCYCRVCSAYKEAGAPSRFPIRFLHSLLSVGGSYIRRGDSGGDGAIEQVEAREEEKG